MKTLSEEQRFRAGFFYQQMRDTAETVSGEPYMAVSPQGKPMDFSFLDIHQYGSAAVVKRCESFSQLLDDFYRERDQIERMRVREADLLRLLTTHSERLVRKIAAQQGELEQCGKRDELRVAGDLLSANLYAIPKGAAFVDLPNFYEEGEPTLRVKLDPALTPSPERPEVLQGVPEGQDRRGEIKRADRPGPADLEYLDTVLDALARAETERDLSEIRGELQEQGYLRKLRGKKEKPPAVSAPLSFTTSDGFTVLVGPEQPAERPADHEAF